MHNYEVTLTKEVYYRGTLVIQAESQSQLNEKIELLMPGVEFKISRIETQIVHQGISEPDLDLS